MISPRLRVRAWLAVALWLAVSGVAVAQQKALSLDDIYDPGKRINFSGAPTPDIAWIDGTHFAWGRTARGGVDWIKVDAATGSEAPLFDAARMAAALARL